MPKLRTVLVLLLVLAAAGGGGWWWFDKQAEASKPQLRTAKVERGTLTATVAASGTLAAVVQVQVSSQVSGQIRDVLADFNAEVRKGQVLARLDPETFEFRVRQTEADVEAARAQIAVQQASLAARQSDLTRATINRDEARRDLERKAGLVERNFISPAERDKAESLLRVLEQDLESARAQVQLAEAQVRNARSTVTQREAQLASARVDLDRTIIRAPVDGVVIKRSIEPGQTVAASLQAPEMFLIAQDLRAMQVEVSIDEAEVSRVRPGQRATFTVDAFAGRTFEGAVTQVRKAWVNQQNVITYTALVSASNDALNLLPGMTANVRIVTDVRNDVLKVPNAALRFKPPGWTEPASGAGAKGATGPTPGAWRAWLEAPWPAAQAQTSPPGGSGASAAGQAGAGQGGGIAAYRERLIRELALNETQQAEMDKVMAALRDRFAGLRDLPPEARAAAGDALRAEMRKGIARSLDAEQKKRFDLINAEIDARRAQAGAVGGATAAAGSGAGAASGAKAAAGSAATPESAGGGGSTGGAAGGGPLAAFRSRLERELDFTEAQKSQLDGIFSGMRSKFATVREAEPAERPRLMERYRAEMRAAINDILDDRQKKKYAEILVELAGRNVSRGRVFVAGPGDKPVPIELRLGLSDGAFTEVISVIGERKLTEGDLVYTGLVTANNTPGAAPPKGPPRPMGPRL
jgi:HlyD family secretion protein